MDLVSNYLNGVKIAVQENHSGGEEIEPVGILGEISKDSRRAQLAAKLSGISQTQGGSVDYFMATRMRASTI
jgi:hypothetical protein